MTENLMDSMPGAKRIIPYLKNSNLYIVVLLAWTFIFQFVFYILTFKFNVSNLDWWRIQVIGFIFSTNIAAEAFTWWSRKNAVDSRSKLTGKDTKILGINIYNIEGYFAITTSLIMILVADIIFSDLIYTLLVSIAMTNIVYVSWGYLSYKEMEKLTEDLHEIAPRFSDTDTTPMGRSQGIIVEVDLDG